MCEVLSYMLENVILLWTSKTGDYRTLRVGFVAGFRLAGAGKSTLKLVVSSWEYEYP